MRKTKIIVTLLCFWLGLMPLTAQSVTITKDFAQVPMASVLAMYKNEFGSYEKPDMTETFPYAVIRMHLEGSGQAVREAKERLTLYMGQQMGVERRVTTYSNQILFLVRSRHPMIYIDCGDGCERVLLSNMQQLQPNCLYDCKVRFVPEKNEMTEGTDREELKKELLSELTAYLQEQEEMDSNHKEQKVENSDAQHNPSAQIEQLNGHEYVDLGLSVKWATYNVGASKPEDYGDYFAWGETRPKSTYNWRTYKWCKGNYQKLTKYNYNVSNFGKVDMKNQLDISDDAAYVIYGGGWRIPTESEFNELREKCIWNWTSKNGANGYLVTSKSNGNSIFLPSPNQSNDMNLYGNYWLRSFNTFFPSQAYMFISSLKEINIGLTDRCNKCLIRPVCP